MVKAKKGAKIRRTGRPVTVKIGGNTEIPRGSNISTRIDVNEYEDGGEARTTIVRGSRANQQGVMQNNKSVLSRGTSVSEKMRQYQWSMGHLYPDMYEPVRFPDQYQFPTHIMRTPMQRTLTIPSTRDFAIYFSPITDCYYNYQFGSAGQMYSNINVNWGTDVFVSYADNNSTKTDNVTGKNVFDTANNKGDLFSNLGNWNYAVKGSDNLKKFKKIRLLAAYLKITYTGKAEDLSGTVRIAMGVRNFTTPLQNDQINVDDLINMPQYKTLTLDKPIICRYRVSNEDFMDFGPYSPYSSIPYFMIYGKGLQEGSSIFVETVKHFEGVVVPEEEEFISSTRADRTQLSGINQMGFVKNIGPLGAIDVQQVIREGDIEDLYRRE